MSDLEKWLEALQERAKHWAEENEDGCDGGLPDPMGDDGEYDDDN